MSDIAKVRSLCQDKPSPQSESFTHVSTTDPAIFSLEHFPLVSSSLVLTPNPATPPIPSYTVDSDTGRITFDASSLMFDFTVQYYSVLLSDEDIQTYIDIENSDDLRLAAADALDAMASSQAIILKKIKMLDLETDGPALAKSLRDHAAMLRKQVFSPEMDEATFDIIEQINDRPGWDEKILKDVMREGS